MTTGRAIHGVIVDDHGDAVARQADIELDCVGAKRQRRLECRDGVLGRMHPISAVRYDRAWDVREECSHTTSLLRCVADVPICLEKQEALAQIRESPFARSPTL